MNLSLTISILSLASPGLVITTIPSLFVVVIGGGRMDVVVVVDVVPGGVGRLNGGSFSP